jgi:hypothetical protein
MMKVNLGSAQKIGVLGLSVLMLGALCHNAEAQSSLFSFSLVAVNNIHTQFHYLDSNFQTDNSIVTVSGSQSFSGMDGLGNPQTLDFSGTTISQSNYGRLHVFTTGSLTNSYYNPANPDYVAPNGTDIADPAGSPSTLSSLGFAVFDDTLQYGGTLQSGYKARYLFHVDGTNTGTGYFADLAFQVDSNPAESFFALDPGFNVANWGTQEYDVNGIVPQHVHVQFSTQTVFDLPFLTDGQNYNGTSDFSSTLTLAGIEMLDQNGNQVSGWTVTSDSGTVYNAIQGSATPEPGALALFAGLSLSGGGLLLRRRFARK